MLKAAILVDEINAMSQLHAIGIEGFRPWSAFYSTLAKIIQEEYGSMEFKYFLYGALPPKELDARRYNDRRKYYEALKNDGINVQKGMCHLDNGILVEKGVDCLISLDMLELSLNNYDILFLFSGDADLVPAVQRAQRNSKVFAILSKRQPARHVKDTVDAIVPLEAIIQTMDQCCLIQRSARNAHAS